MNRVADNLARVLDRIAAACERAGRARDAVRLIAVSKRIPLDALVEAAAADQLRLGENRIQDALPRQDALARALEVAGIAGSPEWHFIGHLQRNKARKAVGRFALIHAVDSIRLAERLSDLAVEAGLRQPVLMEVNVSGEAQKHGLTPGEIPAAAARAAALPGLDLRGFMCMARFGAPETELRETFASLRRLAEAARVETGRTLPELSMGMSDDYEIAVEEGATLLRVGTAVFGPREPLGEAPAC